MNRWFSLFPVVSLLGFSACGGNGGDLAKESTQASSSRSARTQASLIPDANALSSQVSSFAAAPAAADEAATGTGDRFFDGRALRDAGFEVPLLSQAVYAGGGAARRAAPVLVRAPVRHRTDLMAEEPPSPASVRFPPSSEALAKGAGRVLAAFDGFERSMGEAAAPIMSRAGWRAAPRKGRPITMTPTHVTVHHTEGAQTMTPAATAAEVRSIQRYHMAGRAREGKDVWDDIGYHFLIDGAGRVVEGRPAETVGAHAGGANENNIGIAMMGNFMRIKPTAEQVESLARLVSFLAVKYRQDPSRAGFLEGHRHYNNTDCPGTHMMSILAAVGARVDAETLKLTARIKAAPPGQFVPALTSA